MSMRIRWILAVGLLAVGLVWVGQGTGLLRGSSFMVGDVRWAFAGLVLLLAGAILAWTGFRSRSRA
jgi:hypothetical protein